MALQEHREEKNVRTVMSDIQIRVLAVCCTRTKVIDIKTICLPHHSLIQTSISIEHFIPQLDDREIKLVAECMVYIKSQMKHLNTRHKARMKA